jgi:site-specific DNA recombinase
VLKRYFSYIRVSTLKQGQSGTSLGEQREAIRSYAERWNLHVVKEFEEKETAAKQGRPVFTQMLKELVRGKADGIVIHKIDRSARNLKDWADLGALIDGGVEVHFVNESLDLNSRGGRLSADIQAVVAADYIRNLREETRKGFYGRLRQGLYPCPAPVGYLDRGKGQPKEIDPVRGPLVRTTFELYATGRWGLEALVEKMYALGLRNKRGDKITRNGMSHLLHNAFYLGVIKIKTRGETYAGQHRPLISQALFDRVQATLAGKNIEKNRRHVMLFRRLLNCAACGARLIGEIQKGHTYYRCHTKRCPQKTIREEAVEASLLPVLQKLRFRDMENQILRRQIKSAYQNVTSFKEEHSKALRLQLEQVQSRLSKLADAYIDGVLDKDIYMAKKNSLVIEERAAKAQLENLDAGKQKVLQRVEGFLELINNAYLSYKLANPEERRELIKIVTSNLTVEEKKVIVKLNYPFEIVANRQKLTDGSPQRASPRTLSSLLSQLCKYFEEHELFPVSEEKKVTRPTIEQQLQSALKISNQPRFLDKAA